MHFRKIPIVERPNSLLSIWVLRFSDTGAGDKIEKQTLDSALFPMCGLILIVQCVLLRILVMI